MKRSSKFFLLIFLGLSSPLFAFDLEGRVQLEGRSPESVSLEVPAEHQKDCGLKKLSPKLKVSPEGFVANALVWVEGVFGPEAGALNGNYTLDQIQCEFSPHIQLIQKGATLSILNSDGFLHNVRAFDEKARMIFNDAMPKKGQVLKKRFDRAGIFLLRCGVHHWMHAVVVVQNHPYYALTDESGHFKIAGIPEGAHPLRVWHESLGEIKTEVNSNTPFLNLTYDKASNKSQSP